MTSIYDTKLRKNVEHPAARTPNLALEKWSQSAINQFGNHCLNRLNLQKYILENSNGVKVFSDPKERICYVRQDILDQQSVKLNGYLVSEGINHYRLISHPNESAEWQALEENALRGWKVQLAHIENEFQQYRENISKLHLILDPLNPISQIYAKLMQDFKSIEWGENGKLIRESLSGDRENSTEWDITQSDLVKGFIFQSAQAAVLDQNKDVA